MEGNEEGGMMEDFTAEETGLSGSNNTEGAAGSEPILGDAEEIARREKACEELHAQMPLPDLALGPYCPRIFDGWSCWNDTPAGTRAFVQCPDFIPGFDPDRKGHKDCEEGGQWFSDPRTNRTWSNYTTCVDMSILKFHQGVNTVYISGYSVSLIALCISLFIFFYYKSLNCKRVTIHKNLFLSFIINNSMWLMWFFFVVNDPAVVNENGTGCQVLHVFLHYFMVSNYFWMFCEGLYLHTLLVVAFVAEDKIMKWFYLLGWGAPAVCAVAYGVARGSDAEQSMHCWMEDSNYNYILNVPVVVSMLLNLFFLVNIVRVLVTKLRAVNTAPHTNSTKKAVRATLILIPLLGLHYLLIPFRPPEGSTGEAIYHFISAFAASFQGLGVSLLFCFFNGEVLAIFKKKWNQRKEMHTNYPFTTFSYMKTSVADSNTMVTSYGQTRDGNDV
ncbi:calcitonin gene-related peptide type 1 receptor-like isoform X1 [Penaeus chinensis]|uniref:calcitonin gene-related peptide type 1 receptor-like isoform X1 n=1 Tax=Penaeus chinensis TaxID=139456 RepID=UPI001FB62C09|nr:calcitonin gene-related peptide type 1 receptor-like isoform X1 [Penaeus chinensis]